MSGHTAEECIDAIAREITNEIRCEERARERITEAPLEGDVYLLKILLAVIDNQNAALKEQHPMVGSHAELVKALEDSRMTLEGWLAFAVEELGEFDIEECESEKLCPKCESSGCINLKIRNTRAALATLTARKVG